MQGSCSKFLSGERGEGVGAKEERVEKISEGGHAWEFIFNFS